ncbi:MAG: ShlB/FhaC/HecB family hemolysin secretion/activation protein [Deltaproteobacteria bacterium]|nr:ShlB/FhaC/HecB family hemolysin secretion/activation protein [Deltaproteobacteria bacterium]
MRLSDKCKETGTSPFVFLPILTIILLAALPAFCQSPVLDYTGRIEEKRPELLEHRPPPTRPEVVLPTLPAPPPEKGLPESSDKGVFIDRIEVTGVTTFTPEEISAITATYEKRFLTMAEMETLCHELTRLYVKHGYINSGAVIPDQQTTDKTLTISIIEGRLTTINVVASGDFAPEYFEKRIALDAGTPLNLTTLQKRLQLFQQDSRIKKIRAELKPGARPGEAELRLEVETRPPFSLWTAFNNYQSPTIGEERGMATLEHQNLTGHGDILQLTGEYSEGIKGLIACVYTIPINASDTTLQFRYSYNDEDVVEELFGPLDIESKEEIYGVTLRHPVYRSLTQELALALSLDRETNKNYLLGHRFSFSPGEKKGRCTVAPLRFSQEWLYRTQRQVIAARSRFSCGLDIFGATMNRDDIPDGHFFAWLGQVQYARILDFLDLQLLARADIQCADRSLLPIEQMGIGGRYSVRGYRENWIVADQALVASVETRIPLVQDKAWAEYLHFCQFFDYGAGDNVDYPNPPDSTLASIGLGLRWGAWLNQLPFDLHADAEIYWGYQLHHIDQPENGPQNNGVHYQLAITGHF